MRLGGVPISVISPHEHLARRVAFACRVAQRHGQHQRQRTDVVHEGGQQGHQRRLARDLGLRPAAQRFEHADQQIDRAGGEQSAADRQHGGDGDDRGFGEAAKGLGRLDEAERHDRQQQQQRHNVVSHRLQDEPGQRQGQQGEDDDLVTGHRPCPFARMRRGQAAGWLPPDPIHAGRSARDGRLGITKSLACR